MSKYVLITLALLVGCSGDCGRDRDEANASAAIFADQHYPNNKGVSCIGGLFVDGHLACTVATDKGPKPIRCRESGCWVPTGEGKR